MNKSTPDTSSTNDKNLVTQAKDAVTHVASDIANQAREQLDTQFESKKDKAVDTIGDIASALRGTGEKLKGVGPLGDVAGRAADGMDRVSKFFDGKQIGDVVRDVEQFARREPAIFVGAAFAIGLLGGRFLKSSTHQADAPNLAAGQSLGSDYDDDRFTSRSSYAGSTGNYGETYGSPGRDSGIGVRRGTATAKPPAPSKYTAASHAASSTGGLGATTAKMPGVPSAPTATYGSSAPATSPSGSSSSASSAASAPSKPNDSLKNGASGNGGSASSGGGSRSV